MVGGVLVASLHGTSARVCFSVGCAVLPILAFAQSGWVRFMHRCTREAPIPQLSIAQHACKLLKAKDESDPLLTATGQNKWMGLRRSRKAFDVQVVQQ